MGRPAVWFIPFALLITLLTLPFAVRDPIVGIPPIIASVAFGAHLLYRDRPPGGTPSAFLTAALVLLGILALAIVATTLFSG